MNLIEKNDFIKETLKKIDEQYQMKEVKLRNNSQSQNKLSEANEYLMQNINAKL